MRRLFLSGLCLFGFVSAGAQVPKLLHPDDAVIIHLSERLKDGDVEGRIDVADEILNCSGFLNAMKLEIGGTKFGSSDAIRGLKKMTDDMNTLSELLLIGIIPDVKDEVISSFETHTNREIVILRSNGLESVAFLKRYRECERVFYFSNFVMMSSKGAVNEALDDLGNE